MSGILVFIPLKPFLFWLLFPSTFTYFASSHQFLGKFSSDSSSDGTMVIGTLLVVSTDLPWLFFEVFRLFKPSGLSPSFVLPKADSSSLVAFRGTYIFWAWLCQVFDHLRDHETVLSLLPYPSSWSSDLVDMASSIPFSLMLEPAVFHLGTFAWFYVIWRLSVVLPTLLPFGGSRIEHIPVALATTGRINSIYPFSGSDVYRGVLHFFPQGSLSSLEFGTRHY